VKHFPAPVNAGMGPSNQDEKSKRKLKKIIGKEKGKEREG
jgi:hypothetical protein